MKTKSANHGLFITLGILFIAGVTFVFLHEFLGLCVSDIFADKSEIGPTRRYNFMVDLMYFPGSLLLTALLFYWAGRSFFRGTKQIELESDSDLRMQLDNCRKQYDELLIKSSGGKIEAKSMDKSGLKAQSFDASSQTGISQGTSAAQEQEDTANNGSSSVQSDIDRQLEEKKRELSGKSSSAASAAFDDSKAKAAFGKKIKQDDLKLIEGIGPKIASILNGKGINTWQELSQSSPDTISEYLIEVGGASYKVHDPTTWPEQAKMASEGKFEELAQWQDQLKGGKKV